MKPPLVPEQPVPVVPEDGLRRLLAVCTGRDFDARRDTAIIMLLLDAGPRVGELVGMRVSDVDFELEVVGVLGKGAASGRCPSAARPPWPSIATCGSARATGTRRSRGCGSAGPAGSPAGGSVRCWSVAPSRLGCLDCIRISFATPLPTPGLPRAAVRPI
jgi:Phage integrase family